MSATAKPITITADPTPCTQLLDVPVALLTIVLQLVPVPDRLGVCTRVCRSFHAAAVAATNSINTKSTRSQAQCDDAVEWLKRHGSGIIAFKARGQAPACQPSLASLPCPLLRDLDLYRLSLQPGFFSTCTGLTRLLLNSCCVEDIPHATSSASGNPLMQLSVLSSLQHMHLTFMHAGCSGAFLELPSTLLSHLVQLTHLRLGDSQAVLSDAALQHVSALSALQHLNLYLGTIRYGGGLQRLPAAALTGLQHLQHLTALRLSNMPWAINLHSIPAMTVLTAMRVLQLSGSSSVDAAVLTGSSQLQELALRCRKTWDAEGSAALLAAVGQQAQLTRLELLLYGRTWRPPSAAAYSALTASSHLQQLEIQGCELPACAWQQMFPPGRCLPELRRLWLQAEYNRGTRQQLSPADMQAMVSCCPALAYLYLGPQVIVSTAVPLQQLTGLISLFMYAPFQDNAPSIARLTDLQSLHLQAREAGERVTVSGLMQLTVLQQLESIHVTGAALDPGLVPEQRSSLSMRNKVGMSAAALGCCLDQTAAWPSTLRVTLLLTVLNQLNAQPLLCWRLLHQSPGVLAGSPAVCWLPQCTT